MQCLLLHCLSQYAGVQVLLLHCSGRLAAAVGVLLPVSEVRVHLHFGSPDLIQMAFCCCPFRGQLKSGVLAHWHLAQQQKQCQSSAEQVGALQSLQPHYSPRELLMLTAKGG